MSGSVFFQSFAQQLRKQWFPISLKIELRCFFNVIIFIIIDQKPPKCHYHKDNTLYHHFQSLTKFICRQLPAYYGSAICFPSNYISTSLSHRMHFFSMFPKNCLIMILKQENNEVFSYHKYMLNHMLYAYVCEWVCLCTPYIWGYWSKHGGKG